MRGGDGGGKGMGMMSRIHVLILRNNVCLARNYVLSGFCEHIMDGSVFYGIL